MGTRTDCPGADVLQVDNVQRDMRRAFMFAWGKPAARAERPEEPVIGGLSLEILGPRLFGSAIELIAPAMENPKSLCCPSKFLVGSGMSEDSCAGNHPEDRSWCGSTQRDR